MLLNLAMLKGMKPNAKGHKFLDLPAEIRNLVYDFLFANIGDEVVIPMIRSHRRQKTLSNKIVRLVQGKRRHTQYLSMMLTCHQIHTEVYGYVFPGVTASFNIRPASVVPSGRELPRIGIEYGERMENELTLSRAMFGSRLHLITHLKLNSMHNLAYLVEYYSNRNEGVLRVTHKKVWWDFGQLRECAQVDEMFKLLRNVTCISINAAEKKAPWRLSGCLLAEASSWLKQPQSLVKAFPRLREMRITIESRSQRFRRVEGSEEQNVWLEWYTWQEVPLQ